MTCPNQPNDRWLRARQEPGVYADALVSCLKVTVGSTGVKSFSAVCRRGGKPTRRTFGRYPSVTLAEARRRADAFAEGRDEGVSVSGARRPAPLVGEGANVPVTAFLADYVADLKRRGRRYAGNVEGCLVTGRFALAGFLTERYGRTPAASEVTTQDLQAWMAANHERSPRYCLHLRSYVVTAWKWAVEHRYDYTGAARDYGIEDNVAAQLPTAARGRPLDRVLSVDELRTLWRALDMNCATHRAIALLIAMGGLRVSEIAENEALCWVDGWFRVPETKNGRPHDLPITATAEPILAIARTLKDKRSPFLFSNPYDPGRPIQLTAIARAAKRLNASLKLDPWTPRDLRRTMKTHLIERGVDERWLDIWHNHGQTADVARRHYIRAEYVELKQRVAAEVDGFLKGVVF